MALADQQRDLRRQHAEVSRVTRNKDRKRARIVERARNLSNGELLAILWSRTAAKADAKPKAEGSADGRAKAKAKTVARGAAGAADAPAGGGWVV